MNQTVSPISVFFPKREKGKTGISSREDWNNYQSELKNFITSSPSQGTLIVEGSCFFPEEIFQSFSEVKGVFASYFCQPGKPQKAELIFRPSSGISQNLKNTMIDHLKLHFQIEAVESQLTTFVLPRTLSMIYLEALFALKEGVASAQDIDRAMKFGVNYPAGPFEWLRDWEQEIQMCLGQLYRRTQDKRYLYPSELFHQK